MRLRKTQGKRHVVIPDVQVRHGTPTKHLAWISRYVLDIHEKTPVDRIILLGDFYDLPSLSSYDRAGSRAVEGRRVVKDMDAGHKALDELCAPWEKAGLESTKHVTYGNHEYRLERAENDDARLEGVLGDFNFWTWDFKEHPYWKSERAGNPTPVLDGIMYSHLYPLNSQGQVGGGTTASQGCPSAKAQVERVGQSCVAGHRQGFDYAHKSTPSGRIHFGLIAGSCYLHREGYMGKVGDHYWRGIIVINDIHRGYGDLCQVSLDFLARRYG